MSDYGDEASISRCLLGDCECFLAAILSKRIFLSFVSLAACVRSVFRFSVFIFIYFVLLI